MITSCLYLILVKFQIFVCDNVWWRWGMERWRELDFTEQGKGQWRGPLRRRTGDTFPILVKATMCFWFCSSDSPCLSILTHASVQVWSSKYLITDMALKPTNQDRHHEHPRISNRRGFLGYKISWEDKEWLINKQKTLKPMWPKQWGLSPEVSCAGHLCAFVAVVFLLYHAYYF